MECEFAHPSKDEPTSGPSTLLESNGRSNRPHANVTRSYGVVVSELIEHFVLGPNSKLVGKVILNTGTVREVDPVLRASKTQTRSLGSFLHVPVSAAAFYHEPKRIIGQRKNTHRIDWDSPTANLPSERSDPCVGLSKIGIASLQRQKRQKAIPSIHFECRGVVIALRHHASNPASCAIRSQ